MGIVADEAHDPSLAREAFALRGAVARQGRDRQGVGRARGEPEPRVRSRTRSKAPSAARSPNATAGSASMTVSRRRSRGRTCRPACPGPRSSTSDKIEQDALAVNNPLTPLTADPTQSASAGAAQWHDSMKTRLDDRAPGPATTTWPIWPSMRPPCAPRRRRTCRPSCSSLPGAVLASILLALILAQRGDDAAASAHERGRSSGRGAAAGPRQPVAQPRRGRRRRDLATVDHTDRGARQGRDRPARAGVQHRADRRGRRRRRAGQRRCARASASCS